MANEIKDALDAGAARGEPFVIDDTAIPFCVIPEGYEVESVEHMLAAPRRWRAAVTMFDVASMMAYLEKFKGDESRIYYWTSTAGGTVFVGIVNDHTAPHAAVNATADAPGVSAQPGAPAWADHRVTYKCPFSHEWQTWIGNNGRMFTHGDFAGFIDENQLDITQPASAEMLEISRSMRAKKKVDWISDKTLANGSVQLTYSEQVEGAAGPNGQLRIPEQIVLTIPVFTNGDLVSVPAMLRYKLQDGKLSIWYAIVTPHKIVQAAVDGIVTKLRALNLPIYFGDPS